MEFNRCSACGYLHTGPAPDKCPVCGAPKTAFRPYEPPTGLEGTRTLENLKAAFAGESQANRRYTLWARIAELEGNQDAAGAFKDAAAEETAHALGHLAYMGMARGTAENLKAAAEGEGYEFTEMYPGFADAAEAEGLTDIAMYFRQLKNFERNHKERYDKVLGDIEA